MTDAIFVYVTHPDPAGAHTLARALVDLRLAACANIIPAMQTVFRWEGNVETGTEAVMIIKTLRSLFGTVEAYVKAHHPYDCPCIVALTLSAGSQEFLNWLAASTTPP